MENTGTKGIYIGTFDRIPIKGCFIVSDLTFNYILGFASWLLCIHILWHYSFRNAENARAFADEKRNF